MQKKTILKYIEDETTKQLFLDFFDDSNLDKINRKTIMNFDIPEEIKKVFMIQNEDLKNLILFYLQSKKYFNTRSLLDEILLHCSMEKSLQKKILDFKLTIFEELNIKIKEKLRELSEETSMENYKNSLTDTVINDMFKDFLSRDYRILGDFKEEFNLTSKKLQVLEEVLKEKGKKVELSHILYLRRKSEDSQRANYQRICKFVYDTYKKIKFGIEQPNGTYKPYTQLDYCLEFHVDKKTFVKYMYIANATLSIDRIDKFFNPLGQKPMSKEKLFEIEHTFGEKKATEADNEKAYNFLIANKLDTKYCLYKQALKRVVLEEL